MSALQRSSLVFRRLTTQSVQRRGMAAQPETPVTWAEYRSGKKTLAEWVDGNRAQVAFGFFVFYCSLAAYQLRPKKGKKAAKTEEAAPAPASS